MDLARATWNWHQESQTLFVTGAVDEVVVDDLRLAIFEASNHYGRDLTIDLGGVTFLPSMGIGVLASAVRQAAENETTIRLQASPMSIASKILTLSGLPPTPVPEISSPGSPSSSSRES